MGEVWPWLALVLLGAFHGLNPAMGWLFAVARGLQEKRRQAVLEALLPIAFGHALSVVLVVALVSGLELLAAPQVLRPVGAGVLILFGVFRIIRARWHPRWVGMRVSLPELALWSFLMSTAHGAGLMLFPVMLALPGAQSHGAHAVGPDATAMLLGSGIAAVLIHTLAMLLTMALAAIVVYEQLGLAVLRQTWVNLDMLWAFTLIAVGVLTLFT